MKQHTLKYTVRIDSQEVPRFSEFVQTRISHPSWVLPGELMPLKVIVPLVTMGAAENPSLCGFQIDDVITREIAKLEFEVTVECTVTSQMTLFTKAIERYVACWQEESWQPASVESALFELLCGSNPNPDPNQLGFEYLDHP